MDASAMFAFADGDHSAEVTVPTTSPFFGRL